MNFLMSPMLVVAYALVGRVDIDLITDPLDYDPNGNPVYLRDIWPTKQEIVDTINRGMRVSDFKDVYDVTFGGGDDWKQRIAPEGKNFGWNRWEECRVGKTGVVTFK